MLTEIKVYACYTVKIYKNKPLIFFKTGGRARVLDPPLYDIKSKDNHKICTQVAVRLLKGMYE